MSDQTSDRTGKTAATIERAEARLTLVLDYGNPDPAGEPIPALIDEPKAAPTSVVGKRQAVGDVRAPDLIGPVDAQST